jgi:hypothetical protein
MFLWTKLKARFITGPSPIPALTCPHTPELGLPSIHSCGLLLIRDLCESLEFHSKGNIAIARFSWTTS